MRHGNAHTRYTIRTRTRKKCTYTRGRIVHTYAKSKNNRLLKGATQGQKSKVEKFGLKPIFFKMTS